METKTPHVHEAWYKEWLRIIFLITVALPLCLAVLALLGVELSQDVWTVQVLIGIGILLVAGSWSFQLSSEVPYYSWYAASFFLTAFGVWYAWSAPETAIVAHFISAISSGAATLIVWMLLTEQVE